MALEALLLQKKTPILRKWFDLILEAYPSDVATLMRKNSDPFTNPVGSTISREIEVLLKELCGGSDVQQCSASLGAILKIRSVQDFSPSQAVGFVFLLKEAIESTLKEEIHKDPVAGEWKGFRSKIDALALCAFDVYVKCREKIYEIRVNQARVEKEMAFRMMDRLTHSKKKGEKEEN